MNMIIFRRKITNAAPDHRPRLKVWRLLVLIGLCGNSALASCYSPPPGLVNYWPADGSGADLVGTNNATLLNGATFAAGNIGSAFSFDGVNDRIQINGTPIPVPWTAEFWVYRRTSLTNSAVLIGDSATALKLEQYDNNKKVGFTQWGVADYTFNYTAPVSNWVHLVFVGSTTNTRLYVNGSLQDTITTNIALPRGQMGIDISNRFDKPLRGLLDEISLYNRALSAAEIATNFNAGALSKCIAPEIAVPPQPQSVFPGNTASFSVTATGLAPLKYQWRTNGIPIALATNSSYTTPAVQAANNGVGYTVVVTNTAGSVTSTIATLTVCSPTFPDNFDCRLTLSGSSTSVVAAIGAATYEPNEPLHFVRSSSNSIWYTWTAPFSGGLVFQTQGTEYYYRPIVAIYTGASLSNLVKLVANSMVENNAGSESIARAVLTVEAEQAYQIAVDRSAEFGGDGSFTSTLTLTPPPVNDAFSGATPISGIFYSETGTFVGAGRESGEPSHGNAALGQTLWWKWTAPTNGPNPISTRLMTDAVNFPPAVGVYTGSVVSALSSVSATRRTNGMTSDVVFDAIPGQTYYFALAGRQSESNSVSPLIGSFHFRLNTRVLALSITNLVTITNGSDSTVAFQANARVQNLGTNASGPLRLSLFAASGFSTRLVLTEPIDVSVTSLGITNITNSLAAGQSLVVPIAGTVPASSSAGATGIGHAAFADLQEQPVTNHWFTVDQTLVTFGEWPGVGNIIGPGGGVIRFDPGYTASPFSPISAMAILGTNTLTEGRSVNYTGRVTFANTTVQTFTDTTTWSASRFTISTNGVFTAGNVTSNSIVALTVSYIFGGITFITSTNVTVLNLPAPTITNLFLLNNAGLVFTLNGVPGRSNVIEATTNFAAPVIWLPLATNAPASGSIAFTNFSRTNFPVRFFRAREQ
jgi:hypothetical protein